MINASALATASSIGQREGRDRNGQQGAGVEARSRDRLFGCFGCCKFDGVTRCLPPGERPQLFPGIQVLAGHGRLPVIESVNQISDATDAAGPLWLALVLTVEDRPEKRVT
ncbi:hypothetical protein DXT91_11115 [Agrobacterium tumefaciens]|nr:hypothetical protein [Agrobacterium tumefaciens]